MITNLGFLFTNSVAIPCFFLSSSALSSSGNRSIVDELINLLPEIKKKKSQHNSGIGIMVIILADMPDMTCVMIECMHVVQELRLQIRGISGAFLLNTHPPLIVGAFN